MLMSHSAGSFVCFDTFTVLNACFVLWSNKVYSALDARRPFIHINLQKEIKSKKFFPNETQNNLQTHFIY